MHTNNTSHYNLPQFIGSDIPNPLTDWNDSMQDIDAAMYEIKTQADEIGSDIVEDESDISDLQSQANLTDDNITLLNQQTTAARTAATDAQDAANRNASNIATLQQSVTNNRTSITQYNNRFNENVPFAFGIEEVEDPDNPGQTIEQYGYYTNDDPSDFVPFGEGGKQIYRLATSRTNTYDVKSQLSNYANLTIDNFLIDVNTHSQSTVGGSGTFERTNVSCTKSYDASTGVLTVSIYVQNIMSQSYGTYAFAYDIYYVPKGVSNIGDM